MTYHKEYVPDYLTQKRSKNKGELILTQTPGTHETIITKEEYDRVQNIMAEKRKSISASKENKRRSKGHTPNKYVWGKLLICSCGYRFGRHHHSGKGDLKKFAYTCYKKKHTGSARKREKLGMDNADLCLTPTLSEIKLEIIAAYILEHYTKHQDEVLALAKSIIASHINDTEEIDDNTALIASLNDELVKLERKLNTLIEMRTEGEISKELFKSKTVEIEARENEIKTKLEALAPPEALPTESDYTKKLDELMAILESYCNFEVPSEIPEQIVEAFIRKIVVYPEHLEWYLRNIDDDEGPIKTVMSGNLRSGLTVTFNGENEAQFSSQQHRLLLSN